MSSVTRPRALVVDDDPSVLAFLTAAFGRLGWDVTPIDDGENAFTAARAQMPDLVLLDLMMPGLDGYSILARMRQDEALRTLPIVVVSAEPASVHEAIGRDLGADGYLEKPIALPDLKRLLDGFTARSRA